MKTQDIIKYAAMAIAAWMVYSYLKNNGYLAGVPFIGTPAVGGQQQIPGQVNGGGGQQQQQPTNSGGGQQQQPSGGSGGNGAQGGNGNGGNGAQGGETNVKNVVWEAAKDFANSQGGLMHFWQWNEYLPAGVPRPDPFAVTGWDNSTLGRQPTSIDEVEQTPLSLDQWWSMAQPHLGLSGMGMGTVNHWGQQSSVNQGRMYPDGFPGGF